MKLIKQRIYNIIFKADTPGGLAFDIALLVFILLSILLVMLESIENINAKYEELFSIAEWVITIMFSTEYALRIFVSKKPFKYIFSGLGIIDLLSVLPKYLAFFALGSNALIAIRALRLLRVFRLLKLARYIGESNKLVNALKASRVKISVFLVFIVIFCIILGTVMYLIEGAENGFTSIPKSVYWCIVTMTTVGFGDIAPATPLGQLLASVVMILGYGVLAVPTGIVSAEYVKNENTQKAKQLKCKSCYTNQITKNASYCHICGQAFDDE